jgi:hypothetical protein
MKACVSLDVGVEVTLLDEAFPTARDGTDEGPFASVLAFMNFEGARTGELAVAKRAAVQSSTASVGQVLLLACVDAIVVSEMANCCEGASAGGAVIGSVCGMDALVHLKVSLLCELLATAREIAVKQLRRVALLDWLRGLREFRCVSSAASPGSTPSSSEDICEADCSCAKTRAWSSGPWR